MYYIYNMGKRIEEPTTIRSARLPKRLLGLLDGVAKKAGLPSNNLLWRIIEDYLIRIEILDEGDRKRPSPPGLNE